MRRTLGAAACILCSAFLIACVSTGTVTSGYTKDPHSGLTIIYPEHASCPRAASLFGEMSSLNFKTRSDGRHNGIDIPLPVGTPVFASADGTIAGIHKNKETGMAIIVRHEGVELRSAQGPQRFTIYTEYAHLQNHRVFGGKVKKGQIIAESGDHWVGDHLHFGTYTDLPVVYRNPLFILAGALDESGNSASAVTVPYTTDREDIFPAGSTFIWPVACPPKQTAKLVG